MQCAPIPGKKNLLNKKKLKRFLGVEISRRDNIPMFNTNHEVSKKAYENLVEVVKFLKY